MYAIPNINYHKNLENIIIITLMKKLFLEIGSERIFFCWSYIFVSDNRRKMSLFLASCQ